MASSLHDHSLNALPPGTALGDYVIESELGSGGFSIVYLARHNLTVDDPERTWWVAIKEYLPAEVAGRDRDGLTVRPTRSELWEAFEEGLRRFKEEALHMVRFQRLGSVVDCLNLFEANGTAYLVMEYDDGLPLSEFLRLREEQGVPCSEEDLMAVMVPLLECLTDVHRAGVLHRDIKPGNIFVRREDDVTGRAAAPMLLDFGAAKQDYLGKHSRSGAPYTPGYAAFEQTSSMGEMGPWTDIYALGATMWRMVAGGNTAHVEARGANPVDVLARNYALVRGEPDPMPSAVALGSGRFAPHVLAAIDRCLALYPEERPRNCEELLGLLGGATDAVSAESDAGRGGAAIAGDRDGEAPADGGADGPDASPVGKAPVVRRSRSGAIWGLVAALVAVVVLFAYLSGGSGLEFPRIEPGSRSAEDSVSPGPVLEPFIVVTRPPEATVEFLSIDDRYESGMLLLPGRYRVEVGAPGYATRRVWLEHRAGARQEIALESNAWAFTVETEPPGAEVRILNIVARYAPGIRLAAGDYRVEVSAPGYQTVEKLVAHGGAPTRRRIELTRRMRRAGEEFRDRLSGGGEGPEMVVIPAGTFRMGCLSDDDACYYDERPDHDVRISRAFALSKHEVTFAHWDACVSAGGCRGYRPGDYGWGRGSRPVVDVSWEDAKSYVSWLSGETGEVYRLPSESEWEYAARSGTVTKYSWGNEIGQNRANCDGCGSRWDDEQTAPVGSFGPNEFGLHDMHGNVWEWVEDCGNDSYDGAPSDGAAWASGDCAKRVLRGGSWSGTPRLLRSAVRNRYTSSIRNYFIGFRVARTLTP